MSHEGLEPSTLWLKVKCSTNWANGSWLGYLDSNQGNDGVKVRCLTAWLYPNNRMVGRSGFEPLNPKERIYSPPRLASSLPFLIIELMARDGIEPPTHGASIHCSTNWATEPNCGSRIWTYDLRVMSPTSYHAAPPRVIKKRTIRYAVLSVKLFTFLFRQPENGLTNNATLWCCDKFMQNL